MKYVHVWIATIIQVAIFFSATAIYAKYADRPSVFMIVISAISFWGLMRSLAVHQERSCLKKKVLHIPTIRCINVVIVFTYVTFAIYLAYLITK